MTTLEQAREVKKQLREMYPNNQVCLGITKNQDNYVVTFRTNLEGIHAPQEINGVKIIQSKLPDDIIAYKEQILEDTNEAYHVIQNNPELNKQLQEENDLYDNTTSDGIL